MEVSLLLWSLSICCWIQLASLDLVGSLVFGLVLVLLDLFLSLLGLDVATTGLLTFWGLRQGVELNLGGFL